jgi:hypothetical protein
MSKEVKSPYLFSIALAALTLVQSILGLLFQEQYRDAEWIKAAWFGNDWVTLILASPLLIVSIIVPLLMFGGILLWRRHSWGYVIAAIAGILSTLYLIVLSVNSFVAIQRGTADAPGEIPAWGTLALLTAIATLLLLSNVRSEGV